MYEYFIILHNLDYIQNFYIFKSSSLLYFVNFYDNVNVELICNIILIFSYISIIICRFVSQH